MRRGQNQPRNRRGPEASSPGTRSTLPGWRHWTTTAAAFASALVLLTGCESPKDSAAPWTTMNAGHLSLIAIGGCVVAIAAYAVIRRNRRMLVELSERTEQLRLANDRLEREISERIHAQERIGKLSRLKERLLGEESLEQEFKLITDALVGIIDADFARIWVVRDGDLCEKGCPHAAVTEGPGVCHDRSRCLHLVASSGRYTHTDGGHARVPIGAYKIGLIASGEQPKFVTNDVVNDPRTHDPEWARRLGLVSFAGYGLVSLDGQTMGVLALFSKHAIDSEQEALIEDLASTASQVLVAGTALEGLRKSKEGYRRLVEEIDDWVWETTPDTTFTYSSPRVRDILGYEPNEVVGHRPMEFMSPEEGQRVFALAVPFIERGEPLPTFDTTMRRKDGRTVVMQVSGATMHDDQGVFHGHRGIARDITEVRRAEQEIERLSRRNELILNTAGEGIVGQDLDGIATFVNPSAARMLGYEVDDLVGRHGHSAWHYVRPDGSPYPEDECHIHAACRGGASRHVDDEVFMRKDGTSFPVQYVSTPIWENGELAGAVVVFTDVTERMRAEAALRESEATYRNLVETTDTGYLIVDAAGRVVSANAEYVRLTGRHSIDEIAGRTVLEWTASYDLERNAEEVAKCAKTGKVRNLAIDYVWPDGTTVPIEVSATTIETREGPRILSLCRDITDRRLAEDEIRESGERYRLLFDRSADVVFLMSGEQFLLVNPAVTRVFGHEPEELIGHYPWEISPERQPDGMLSAKKARQHIELAYQEGPQVFEWLHCRKDGTPIDCEVGLTAYTYRGENYIQAIVRDVSERKRAEEHRRTLEKQMEAAKQQFYRQTILAVTDGKLDICEPSDVEPYVTSAELKIEVRDPRDAPRARREVERFCVGKGLAPDRLDSFMHGVGEAITNAIKHAPYGCVYSGTVDESVWVGVADEGPGMSALILPRAALLRGFSTKPSMGLGYTIMLDVADRILLKTSNRGTTVILVKGLREPIWQVRTSQLPDTWDSVPRP